MCAGAQKPKAAELRSLVIALGDQLDLDAAAFDGFDTVLAVRKLLARVGLVAGDIDYFEVNELLRCSIFTQRMSWGCHEGVPTFTVVPYPSPSTKCHRRVHDHDRHAPPARHARQICHHPDVYWCKPVHGRADSGAAAGRTMQSQKSVRSARPSLRT